MTRTWPGPLLVRFGGCVVALKTIITTTTRQLTIAELQQCESCKLQQAAVQWPLDHLPSRFICLLFITAIPFSPRSAWATGLRILHLPLQGHCDLDNKFGCAHAACENILKKTRQCAVQKCCGLIKKQFTSRGAANLQPKEVESREASTATKIPCTLYCMGKHKAKINLCFIVFFGFQLISLFASLRQI